MKIFALIYKEDYIEFFANKEQYDEWWNDHKSYTGCTDYDHYELYFNDQLIPEEELELKEIDLPSDKIRHYIKECEEANNFNDLCLFLGDHLSKDYYWEVEGKSFKIIENRSHDCNKIKYKDIKGFASKYNLNLVEGFEKLLNLLGYLKESPARLNRFKDL